ncbi:hypothetical protein G6F31_014175 [Rhizopus arrhizus]|nr:hypothetical protein G6F31_014175 [Rhizopus arrhizus]
MAEAFRQGVGQARDLGHRLAGADTRRWLAGDFHRRQTVVALQRSRCAAPVRADQRRQRHHLPCLVAHAPALDVLRLHARFGRALDEHLLDATLVDEVVDEIAAQRRIQGVIDVLRIHAHGLCLGIVHLHRVHRRVLQAGVAHIDQLRIPGSLLQQRVACGHGGGMAGTALVLQFQGETAGIAEAEDGRRRGDEHLCIGHAGHGRGQARGDGIGIVLAVVPVFQADEGLADVLAAAGDTETSGGLDREHAVVLHCGGTEAIHHCTGLLQGGPGRQLHQRIEHALVFIGQERTRQVPQQQAGDHAQHQVEHHAQRAPAKETIHTATQAVGGALEAVVEPDEELAQQARFAAVVAVRMPALGNLVQDAAAQGRRNGHRHQHRQDHRRSNRHRELPIDHAARR